MTYAEKAQALGACECAVRFIFDLEGTHTFEEMVLAAHPAWRVWLLDRINPDAGYAAASAAYAAYDAADAAFAAFAADAATDAYIAATDAYDAAYDAATDAYIAAVLDALLSSKHLLP